MLRSNLPDQTFQIRLMESVTDELSRAYIFNCSLNGETLNLEHDRDSSLSDPVHGIAHEETSGLHMGLKTCLKTMNSLMMTNNIFMQ